MRKTLPNIVSFLLLTSILTGCGSWGGQYDKADYTIYGNNRAIPVNQLGTVPYDMDIKNIWSIDPYKYQSNIKVDDKKITSHTYTFYGNTVFVLDDNGVLSAYHLETNELYWQRKMSFEKTILAPYIKAVNGVIVMGIGNVVYGIDAESGAIFWLKKIPEGINSAISASRGIVLLQTDSYLSYAINAKNGNILWTHQAHKRSISFAYTSPFYVQGDNAYVLYPSGDIHALELNTGHVLWTSSLGANVWDADANVSGAYTNEIIGVGTNLYIGSSNGMVHAIRNTNGSPLWSRTISSNTNMTALGNVLYIAGNDSVLRAISTEYGNEFWSVNLDKILKRDDVSVLYTHFYKGKIILFTKRGEIIVLSIDTGGVIAIHNSIPVIERPMNKVGKMILLDSNGNLKAYK